MKTWGDVSADYDAISDRIVEALRNVWQAIGSDVVLSSGEDYPDAETIREVVGDGRGERIKAYGGDDQAAAAFFIRTYDEKLRLLAVAFPDEEESR